MRSSNYSKIGSNYLKHHDISPEHGIEYVKLDKMTNGTKGHGAYNQEFGLYQGRETARFHYSRQASPLCKQRFHVTVAQVAPSKL
jgi:hypothetical protein